MQAAPVALRLAQVEVEQGAHQREVGQRNGIVLAPGAVAQFVCREDQRLVGIVTLQNLMHSMALLAESRKLRRDEGE